MNERQLDRTPLWVTLLGVLGPFVVSAVTAVALLRIGSRLPERVAVHWGLNGQPNGWESPASAIAVAIVLPSIVPFVVVAVGIGMRLMRVLAPIATATAVFIACLTGGTTWDQRDGGSADPDRWLLIGLVLAGIIGVLMALILRDWRPRPSIGEPPPAGALTYEISPTVRLAWAGKMRQKRWWIWLIGGIGIVPELILGSVFGYYRQWVPMFLMVLLIVCLGLAFSLMSCRIMIDRRGLRVVGFGIAWKTVPLDEVVSADAIDHVEPFAEFGGWGWRIALDGQCVGLITSAGEALEVRVVNHKSYVFTIDDAAGAAATLNTLVAQRQSR